VGQVDARSSGIGSSHAWCDWGLQHGFLWHWPVNISSIIVELGEAFLSKLPDNKRDQPKKGNTTCDTETDISTCSGA
jgi:hypothetical protein